MFTETLVRVLTILVSDDKATESQTLQIEKLVQQGFIYARPIAETIAMMEKAQQLSNEWLELCIKACATVAEQSNE